MTAYCDARTKSGTRCRREAGWGTNHLGAGACKLHGGRTQSGELYGAKQLATAYAAERFGLSGLQPTDALLMCIRDTAGFIAYCKMQLAGVEADKLLVNGERTAWLRLQQDRTKDLAHFSKMALDAGVAERMVRLAENMGRLLAAAFAQAIDPLDLSDKQRQEVVRRFGAAVAELEQADPEVLEGQTA